MAMVPVVQREWVAKHPRATFKTPITVEDVLNSRMIAYQPALPKSALVVLSGYGTLHAKKESATAQIGMDAGAWVAVDLRS
jgi:acetyl-CoA acetyltransferase